MKRKDIKCFQRPTDKKSYFKRLTLKDKSKKFHEGTIPFFQNEICYDFEEKRVKKLSTGQNLYFLLIWAIRNIVQWRNPSSSLAFVLCSSLAPSPDLGRHSSPRNTFKSDTCGIRESNTTYDPNVVAHNRHMYHRFNQLQKCVWETRFITYCQSFQNSHLNWKIDF